MTTNGEFIEVRELVTDWRFVVAALVVGLVVGAVAFYAFVDVAEDTPDA